MRIFLEKRRDIVVISDKFLIDEIYNKFQKKIKINHNQMFGLKNEQKQWLRQKHIYTNNISNQKYTIKPKQKNIKRKLSLNLEQTLQVKHQKQQLLKQRMTQLSNQQFPYQKQINDKSYFDYLKNDQLCKMIIKQQYQNSQTVKYPILNRIHQLNQLVQKIIQQCSSQSSHVKKGLLELKSTQMQIIKQLSNQDKYLNNQSEQVRKQGNFYLCRKMLEVKQIIQRIMNECQINNKQARQSLENIKIIQDRLMNDLSERDLRQNEKKQELFDEYKKFKNLLSDKNEQQIIQKRNDQQNVFDQIEGLNQIEIKVFNQILNLRQEKLQLMKQINHEIKKTNQITRNYKKLQRQYYKVIQTIKYAKSQNSSIELQDNFFKRGVQSQRHYILQDNNNLTNFYKKKIQQIQIQAKYQKQTQQKQIQKLKSIIKKLQQSNTNLNMEVRQLKLDLDTKQKQLREKIHQQRRYQDISIYKNQIKHLKSIIKQYREKQKTHQRSHQNHLILQQQLNNLKQNNQKLRMDMIKILKNKGYESHQNSKQINKYRQQIEMLQNYISKQNEAKTKFIGEITAFKKKLINLQQQNKELKKKLQDVMIQKQHHRRSKYNSNDYERGKKMKQKNNQQLSNYGNNKYLIKQQEESIRLQQYRDLLSGLRNITTQN